MNKSGEALHLRLHGLTYAEIGRRLGISRQRAQQLTQPPKAIRDMVVNRDGGLCQSCYTEVGMAGHVHHKGATDGDAYNDFDNLELLCIPCHLAAHSMGDTPRICLRCNHEWLPRQKEPPVRCPACASPYWNRPKRTVRD